MRIAGSQPGQSFGAVTFSYLAYGLRLEADVSIPGLLESPPTAEPDLRIWLGSKPAWVPECPPTPESTWYVSPEKEDGGRPSLVVEQLALGAYFRLTYSDGTVFVLDRDATRLWATWPPPFVLEDTVTYLVGPVIGFVQRIRGITCLHASAVAVAEKAVALMGAPGAGKSTTAAAFARSGYAVLTDDVVPLHPHGDSFLVHPGYPRVCLWPVAVQALCGAPDVLPFLTPNWPKCYLTLGGESHRFHTAPLPLSAIYLLGERTSDPRAPWVEPVPAAAGMMALVKNTYMSYLLDKERRAREFDLLGRLLERVPLREVRPHAAPPLLPQLCEVIVEDFRALPPAAVVSAQGRPA